MLKELGDGLMYRRNAFRLTGVPPLLNEREMRRYAERRAMERRLGREEPATPGLVSGPPPTAAEIAEAERRLASPERRFLDEAFWLWPAGTPGGRLHDAAVGAHRDAMEADVSDTPWRWPAALRAWSEVLRDEAAWARLEERRVEIDDPRVPLDAVAQLRAAIPGIVVASAMAHVRRYAEAGRVAQAQSLVLSVHAWPRSDSSMIDRAARQALGPERDQIRLALEAAERDSEAVPAAGLAAGEALLEATRIPLSIVDALLSGGHALRAEAHDDVALRCLRCQVRYGDATDDWEGSLRFLERIEALAEGAQARARIAENLRIVKSNAEGQCVHGRCWFCTTEPREKPAPGRSIKKPIHGEVKVTPVYGGANMTWRHGVADVPRCQRCADAHEALDARTGMVTLAVAIAGVVALGRVWSAPRADFGSILLALIGIALAWGVAIAVVHWRFKPRAMREGQVRPKAAWQDWPPVKQLFASGWATGARPPRR